MKMEREQHQTEIRDLQDQLSEMHDELDSTKRSEDREKGALIEVRELWARCQPRLPQTMGLHGLDAASQFLLCAFDPLVSPFRFCEAIIVLEKLSTTLRSEKSSMLKTGRWVSWSRVGWATTRA